MILKLREGCWLMQNDSEKGIYNVKAISKKIGIQPGTLRAWERRYQIVTPKRNEVGHRIYSEQDLAILKWLVDKVNQGFTISQAVDLLSEKTKESPSLFATDEILDSKKEEITQNLYKALIQLNALEAEALIEYALSLYRIEVVLFEIIAPLIEIGNVSNRVVTEGQMLFLQSWIRIKLFGIFQQIPLKPYLSKVITLAPRNTKNYDAEIKILLYSIFLKLRGFEVYYLGPINEEALQIILQKIEPLFVFGMSEETILFRKLKYWVEENYPRIKLGVISREVNETASEMFIGDQTSEWIEWLNQYVHKNQYVVNE